MIYRGRQYTALSPDQKAQKKDYLLQQGLRDNHLPNLEELLQYLEQHAEQEDKLLYHSFLRLKEHTGCEGKSPVNECVADSLRLDYDDAVAFVTKRVRNGQDCYRALSVPEQTAPESMTRLGVFWTTEQSRAKPYYKEIDEREELSVVFKARVDTQYIDLLRAVADNFVYSEAEVRFLPNAPIWVESYKFANLAMGLKDKPSFEWVPVEAWRRC